MKALRSRSAGARARAAACLQSPTERGLRLDQAEQALRPGAAAPRPPAAGAAE